MFSLDVSPSMFSLCFSLVFLQVGHYVLPVHMSRQFLFTPTLASALYLLMVRFFQRDYKSVCALAPSVVSDSTLDDNEQQLLEHLEYLATGEYFRHSRQMVPDGTCSHGFERFLTPFFIKHSNIPTFKRISDTHPDAHACRVKLSLSLMGNEEYMHCPWDFKEEFKAYVQVFHHVSVSCRLTPTEEYRLSGSLLKEVRTV